MIGIWAISIGSVFPYIETLRYEENAEYQCQQRWSDQTIFIYFLTFYLAIVFLPTLLIAILYWQCSIKLRQSADAMSNTEIVLRRLKQNKRLNRLFVFIVIGFTLLTSPYWIFYVIYMFLWAHHYDWVKNSIVMYTMNYGLFTFATFNSVINPFLYAKIQGFRNHRKLNTK